MIRSIILITTLYSICCAVAIASDHDPNFVIAESDRSVQKQTELESLLIESLLKLDSTLSDDDLRSENIKEIINTKRRIGDQQRAIVVLLGNFKSTKTANVLIKFITTPFDPLPPGRDHNDAGDMDPTPAMQALEKLGEVAVLPLIKRLEEGPDIDSQRLTIQILASIKCDELVAATLAWRYDMATSDKKKEIVEFAFRRVTGHGLTEKRGQLRDRQDKR